MNDLISINYEKEQPTVSGRDLHAGLEITTPYHIWFPRMCEYGFRQEKDYSLVEHFCTTNNPKNPLTTGTDHILSLSNHEDKVFTRCPLCIQGTALNISEVLYDKNIFRTFRSNLFFASIG